MATETSVRPVSVEVGRAGELRRRVTPVKWWAALGAGLVVLQVYVYGAWIADGPTRTPTGSTPVPTAMKWSVIGWQVGGVVISAVMLYLLLVRPWRREGRITLDGLLCLAFPTMIWQDTVVNFFQQWFVYNAAFVNWGSWDSHVPGWLSQGGELIPQPLLFIIPMYLSILLLPAILGCAVMRKAQARWPHIGRFGLVASCFGFFVVLDVVLEPLLMWSGMYSYPGAIRWLTVFDGHYYQYPIYAAILMPAGWTGWACLRYFKDDHGLTIAERGLERIRTTPRRKAGLRFLAVAGACNAAVFCLTNFPYAVTGLYADTWIPDVLNRSYFTSGICGPGTDYACSGPGIAIPRRDDSIHVGPDGQLVIPPGTNVPSTQ